MEIKKFENYDNWPLGAKEMDSKILQRIKNSEVDCPECEYMDDDQYQCVTCGCGGGGGMINIFDWVRENKSKIE